MVWSQMGRGKKGGGSAKGVRIKAIKDNDRFKANTTKKLVSIQSKEVRKATSSKSVLGSTTTR